MILKYTNTISSCLTERALMQKQQCDLSLYSTMPNHHPTTLFHSRKDEFTLDYYYIYILIQSKYIYILVTSRDFSLYVSNVRISIQLVCRWSIKPNRSQTKLASQLTHTHTFFIFLSLKQFPRLFSNSESNTYTHTRKYTRTYVHKYTQKHTRAHSFVFINPSLEKNICYFRKLIYYINFTLQTQILVFANLHSTHFLLIQFLYIKKINK